MGLNPFWQEDFFLTVQHNYHAVSLFQTDPYYIVQCGNALLVHLIPTGNKFAPKDLVTLQEVFQAQQIQLVQLWEDVWLSKRPQVLSRLRSFLGNNTGIHARKTKIIELNKKQAEAFLTAFHIQGYVNAATHYGLTIADQLTAVASFSSPRPMKEKGDNYLSAELVRFASADGYTVVGGLSKLIKHFLKQKKPDDLMSYADRDWSLGKGYSRLGFDLSGTTSPAWLYLNKQNLNRYFPHRLPKNLIASFENQKLLNFDDYLALNGYIKVFNTGNLKYHLYL